MRIVLDIETNGLENPTKVWLVVCKDIDTNQLYVFRENGDDPWERLERYLQEADQIIGHNILEYDLPVLSRLCNISVPVSKCRDTLILSRLINYSREDGHSIASYGIEFNFPKGDFKDFSKYSLEMEEYCVRDVEICHRVYQHYADVISDPAWAPAIELEHQFQQIVNGLHNNGFSFDVVRGRNLLVRVERELAELDEKISSSFPSKLKLIKEIHPKITKHGTISKQDFRWVKDGDLSEFNGGPFSRCSLNVFNPSSPKQVVEVLNAAGWKPVAKTKTHLETERLLNRNRYSKTPLSQLDLKDIHAKLDRLKIYGYKISEENLETLPSKAPPAARLLAKRILLESRRRTLTEWLALVHSDGRIRGKFVGLGAWTHRMAHQSPNTANIPGEFQLDGTKKLYGKEMRSLWRAPKNRLLVGVDAEGIQLRIFAHYIDDPEFTCALVEGKKDDKTDPHSLNQRIMGSVCKSRATAKRFIYALLLGAGIGKLAEILECSIEKAREALDRILQRYTGFASLKSEVLPQDGKRGWFSGLDGRRVTIPGDTAGTRTHLAMSGYLQSGEAIVMKRACLKWQASVPEDCKIVNFVHDEWQTEVPNDMSIAIKVAKMQADSLRIVGEELGLKCPLAGSYWNDDHKDYTIGTNWYQTH